MDGRTDKPSYRDARTHLKREIKTDRKVEERTDRRWVSAIVERRKGKKENKTSPGGQ